MRSEQLIQQGHASSCMPAPLAGSLQPSECLQCIFSLWPGKFMEVEDVTKHGQKRYFKAQIQL